MTFGFWNLFFKKKVVRKEIWIGLDWIVVVVVVAFLLGRIGHHNFEHLEPFDPCF